MGVDGDLTSIIREIVQFLESLYDVDLPLKIENARVNLLQRSKTKLSTIARGSVSPEPYLDMNAGKGFLLFTKKKNRDVEIEEYVGIEEQTDRSEIISHHDYYESFLEIDSVKNETSNDDASVIPTRGKSCRKPPPRDEQVEKKLREIYRTFTAAKTISKAHKSGALYQKVERKPFGFVRGNIRLCWIGLVGSHLLIHASEDDKQPPEICSIRGYSARPAPSSVSRDPERAKSAFEIFCPGNKTLQFIAKSPKEMEEWLEAISRTCMRIRQDRDENSEDENVVKERSVESECTEEKYQDVGQVVSSLKIKESPILPITNGIGLDDDDHGHDDEHDGGKKLDTTRNSIILSSASSPPILPIRMIPRRLPSLPSEEITRVASYEPLDNGYEDDDIYHKIEDFRDNGRSYENVKKSKNGKKLTKNKMRKRKREIIKAETYDDVECKDSTRRREENNETYDDVRSVIEDKRICNIVDDNSTTARKNHCDRLEEATGKKEKSFENYDDVFKSSSSTSSSFSSLRISSSRGKTKTSESKASKQMKSKKTPTKSDKSLKKSEKSSTKSEKSPTKSEKSSTKSEKISTKSPHKRSFLDRVRHRKDSSKKDEKKRSKENVDDTNFEKEKILVSSKSLEAVESKNLHDSPKLDLLTYDDVTDLAIDEKNFTNKNNSQTTRISIRTDEISNYNCPPPPRPIYSKPSSPVVAVVAPPAVKNNQVVTFDDVYDDIGNYRENLIDGEIISSSVNEEFGVPKSITREKAVSKVVENETIEKMENNRKVDNICAIGESSARISMIDEERAKILSQETEHYQIPRGDSVQVNLSVVQVEEQLYDDIAILADFRARQRDSSSSTSGSPNKLGSSGNNDVAEKSTILTIKKPWNRFGSVKKIASRDSFLSQASSSMKNKSLLDKDDDPIVDSVVPIVEKQEAIKLNKLQKLINKMECTLGKQPSSKSVAPDFS